MALVVHGGAWNIPDESVDAHRRGVVTGLEAGWACLQQGGSAVDAVEASVQVLEDDPIFDAGTGSMLNQEGQVEQDAIVVRGSDMQVGSVAAVRFIKNPIHLARMVLERSEHVLLVGDGARRFAAEHGIEIAVEDISRAFRTVFPRMSPLAFGDSDAARLERQERDWWRTLVRACLGAQGQHPAFGEYFDALYRHYADPAAWVLYPEVPALLDALDLAPAALPEPAREGAQDRWTSHWRTWRQRHPREAARVESWSARIAAHGYRWDDLAQPLRQAR